MFHRMGSTRFQPGQLQEWVKRAIPRLQPEVFLGELVGADYYRDHRKARHKCSRTLRRRRRIAGMPMFTSSPPLSLDGIRKSFYRRTVLRIRKCPLRTSTQKHPVCLHRQQVSSLKSRSRPTSADSVWYKAGIWRVHIHHQPS